MNEDRKKFQELLRELFQFDCADLDFGIYRIMNQKRALIEQFIEKDLLDAVGKELKKGALREQGDLADQLAKLAAKIREDIADDAIDADGRLAEAHGKTKLGKQYLELQAKAASATTSTDLEAQVFNHLWAFFSRYYDNGDFLATRRYSRREKYVIPYNGEEVYLHWANRDQYYIKTGENFTDYQWKAGEVTVLFKLVQAETEKDNVKSDTKRLFVPRLDEVAVDKKVVTLPFEYRGLTEQEGITFGKKNQQEAIIGAALESLPKRKALRESPAVLAAVMAEYRKTEKGESVSRLGHHLRRYTGKNTRDYFIHKDLEGFLTRELDFYLKNEVLALDDLAAGGAERAKGWFQLLEAIRAVGGKIIAFLAQIENFQKRVFEKRKFVTETNYCFTLDRVPKALWPQILKNKAQIEEWKRLYSIQDLKGYSDPLKQAFLEAWPSLMIDTRFFAADISFIDTLLATQKDLEESLGGLLVHSENFQALNLLLPRFSEQVKCIYIDPPYNTGNDDFLYKDSFQHSSWLALMANTSRHARDFLTDDGVLTISLDDTETGRLLEFMPVSSGLVRLGEFVWRTRNTDNRVLTNFSTDHEFIHLFTQPGAALEGRLIDRSDFSNPDNDKRGPYVTDPLTGKANAKDRPNLHYTIVNPNTGDKFPPDPDFGWITDEAGFRQLLDENRVWWPENPKTGKPRKKRFLKETNPRAPISSLAISIKQGEGNKDLSDVMGSKLLNFPKPTSVISTVFDCCSCDNDIVLDYFSGSGSSGHAALNMLRSSQGARMYLLIECATHFDAIILPRMQKIVFSGEWEAGKPVVGKNGKSCGISHAFKYIRLESYEDALGNISFVGPQGDVKFDDYMLRYMLGIETRKSETLLNAEKLIAPFSYQLSIMEGSERKTKSLDLSETFNYLLGLKVSSRQVHLRDGKQRYLVIRGTTNPHGEGGERTVCVIWRDVTGWKAADFKADAEFVRKEELATGVDEVFVNADSVIPDARVLDPVFKERMFARVAV